MRRTFFSTLADLADKDERIFLLTADIGFGVIDAFSDRHPDKFLNCGVAEQNMIGVATGMAEAGYIPFCYSITPFVTLRPLEFILRGPILHRLPVCIVGAGRGREYGANGETHWAGESEDVMAALTRSHGVEWFTPVTIDNVHRCIERIVDRGHPACVTLSKGPCE